MRIYIPSMGRAHRQTTLRAIPRIWMQYTSLVVPQSEYGDYIATCGDIPGLSILGTRVKGIARTRQWILDHCEQAGHGTCLMLDDDMYFYVRPNMTKPKLEKLTNITPLLKTIHRLSIHYVMVGISARQGNNTVDTETRECGRAMNAYAFNIPFLREAGVKFGRIPVMEDFDVTLQLLRKGWKNIVLYKYCWNQTGSNAEGGCSTYRTWNMQANAAMQLKRLHPDFVTVVRKTTKVWGELKDRVDVRVQWRKAYESSQ